MKTKTLKIIYWVVTILFCGFMLFSGISELLQLESAKAALESLGYPIYLNYILGIAKALGALAILQTMWRTIKEWAYAGFLIDFLGAGASMYFNGDGLLLALFPAVFIAVMFVSYVTWKKAYPQ